MGRKIPWMLLITDHFERNILKASLPHCLEGVGQAAHGGGLQQNPAQCYSVDRRDQPTLLEPPCHFLISRSHPPSLFPCWVAGPAIPDAHVYKHAPAGKKRALSPQAKRQNPECSQVLSPQTCWLRTEAIGVHADFSHPHGKVRLRGEQTAKGPGGTAGFLNGALLDWDPDMGARLTAERH